MRNALAAHTICQAWGNMPKEWAADPNRQALLNGIAGMFPDGWSGGLPESGGSDEVDRVLGLTSAEAEPVLDFSFAIDGPKHHVRVLDTRMRRQYDTAGASPGLLTQAALDHQLPQADLDDLPDGHVLVVVSPAPVFGPPLLSEIGGAILMSKHDVFNIARSETERALEEDVTGLPLRDARRQAVLRHRVLGRSPSRVRTASRAAVASLTRGRVRRRRPLRRRLHDGLDGGRAHEPDRPLHLERGPQRVEGERVEARCPRDRAQPDRLERPGDGAPEHRAPADEARLERDAAAGRDGLDPSRRRRASACRQGRCCSATRCSARRTP